MTKKENITGGKLVDFPEEVDERSGVRIYGETSYENQMAVLSHFLHGGNHDIKEKAEIVACVREFLARKKFRQGTSNDLNQIKTNYRKMLLINC